MGAQTERQQKGHIMSIAVTIPSLGIFVQYTYDEESGVGVWQVTTIDRQKGLYQHHLMLYSDGDMSLAHVQERGTTFEMLTAPSSTETKQ
jgi:hypothetical protein